jgi:hypothetical protein
MSDIVEVDHAKALREFGSYNVMCEAADYIDRLRAERDALAKDAARYRWLRNGWFLDGRFCPGIYSASDGATIDALIDAALAERQP